MLAVFGPIAHGLRPFAEPECPDAGSLRCRPHHHSSLCHRFNWIRPHQFNDGLAPAQYEKNLNVVSGMS
ncbi:hypothetical protein C6380_20785 [Pseudomonas syringae pv. actinidiae]|nr:hypothetical protein C6380_20785 [Pseudomonas syringae pv. actinidiae]RJX53600.1 hypothetical protein C6379_17155 [Pseudomonas syringae pv. actinidiae]RJX59779.1 hypothetical protein C6383_14825 [Pseudomonas syringae pv. actinidiae]RJY20878.1 hypothetical protein C6381_21205 [Pseudomonas syringae pv. actinidiae]